MKIKNQNKPFFTVLTLVLLLVGCGLRGPLYQTPDAEPTDKVTTETKVKANKKVSEEKIQKSESVVQTDEIILQGSETPEHNENEHISKEHE